jgi:hypothetical protein
MMLRRRYESEELIQCGDELQQCGKVRSEVQSQSMFVVPYQKFQIMDA